MVEVVNSIFTAQKRVQPSQLKDWLIGRESSDQKSDQLEITADAIGAEEKILIAVVDTFDSIVSNTHSDYCEAARLAWESLGGKDKFHIAFVTGRGAVGHGRDDCVFPTLRNN